MNIFPFSIVDAGNRTTWFTRWVMNNRDTLDEQQGRYTYSGDKKYDSKKHFSYYEADVEFVSLSEMVISFYGMENPVYGGRGEFICKFSGVPDTKVAQQLIEQRILELTIQEYDRRADELLKKQREDGLSALRQELFGKLKY